MRDAAYYRIYAKVTAGGRFSPLDIQAGAMVTNLIYATLIEGKNRAEGYADEFRSLNPDFFYEVRKAT